MNMQDWFYGKTTSAGFYEDAQAQENALERFAQYSNSRYRNPWSTLPEEGRQALLNGFLLEDRQRDTAVLSNFLDSISDDIRHLAEMVKEAQTTFNRQVARINAAAMTHSQADVLLLELDALRGWAAQANETIGLARHLGIGTAACEQLYQDIACNADSE
jgi:hypothetical protein